jgi:predicted metal-dependent enzyme (double-stranded beta helix superfamily)
MTAIEVPSKTFQQWLAQLPHSLNPCPAMSVLESYGRQLQILARTTNWSAEPVRVARPGEELLYSLACSERLGTSLYLVSDGPGVTSPPHEHTTWAVIVGMQGIERNTLYRQVDRQLRTVAVIEERDVGPHECLALPHDAIHATTVVEEHATFHLHLYGRPLHKLVAFERRVFYAPDARPNNTIVPTR